MDKKSKFWGNVKHYLFLFLALGGVGLLMFLYISFVGNWFGNFSTKNARFGDVADFADKNHIDIQVFSESEIAGYDKGSGVPKNIEKTGADGEIQEMRDIRSRIFEKAKSGCVYVSEASGNVCARYEYETEGDVFYIIYDSGNADKHKNNGAQFVYIIGDSLIAASDDSIIL